MISRKALLGLSMAAILVMSAAAYADVDALSLKFGGGCTVANTSGNCNLKTTATGTDLASEAVRFKYAQTEKGPWTLISKRSTPLSESGRAVKRIKNVPGCYKAVTAPNGNDKPDRTSRAVCEK